ncbi:peptidoglycan-binding domain-containing protein [Streptomyces sp. NPDC051907]|uniref:peptidoglycan-binding domain-containing protein n=1 Tax=Streptomyces sp. NPDC051907 TaxID=3155284 RepID=UPI003413CDB4
MQSIRFTGITELEECRAGFRVLLHQTPNQAGYFVSSVQQALKDLGVAVSVDGFFGPGTEAAVMRFQSDSPGLGVDGKVGAHTMGALDDAFAAEPGLVQGCVEPEGPTIPLDGVAGEEVNLLLSAIGVSSLVEVSELGTVSARTPARLLGVDAPAMAEAARDANADPHSAFAGFGAPAVRLGDHLAALLAEPALADWLDAGASVDAGAQWLSQQAAAFAAGQPLTLPSVVVFGPPPPPVRALTPDMAFRELAGRHLAGVAVMSPPPALDSSGGVIVPAPIPRVTLKPSIAGVTFRNTPRAAARDAFIGSAVVDLILLDVRHAVGMVRLAQFLSSQWSVDEIRHVGIGGSVPATECHTGGRAIDFVGVHLTSGGVGRDVHVFDHWAAKPVPAPDRPGHVLPQWPPGSVPRLNYRLAAVDDLGTFPADTVATRFFFDLYIWFAEQYQDRTPTPLDPGPPTTPGETSFVMSPDHPTSDPLPGKHGREAHATHLHAQIGTT